VSSSGGACPVPTLRRDGAGFATRQKCSFRACSEKIMFIKSKASFLSRLKRRGATTKLVDRFSILVAWILDDEL